MANLSSDRLVCITWVDPHGSISEFAKHEIPHAPAIITSYGLLLRWDAEGISIATEETGSGNYRGHTFILPELVVSVLDLGVPSKKRPKPLPLPPECIGRYPRLAAGATKPSESHSAKSEVPESPAPAPS